MFRLLVDCSSCRAVMQFCSRAALIFTVLCAIVILPSPSVLGYPTKTDENVKSDEEGSSRTLQGLKQDANESPPTSHQIQSIPLSSEEYQSHPDYTVAIAHQRLPVLQELNVSEEKLQGKDKKQDTDVRLKRSNQDKTEILEAEDDSDEDKTSLTEDTEDANADAQHFFPSFAPIFSAPPPLGHSRPPYYNPEPAYSQRPTFPGGFRDLPYTQAVAESESNANVLGSGNFGVIRGGTYYAEERDDILNDDIYSPYYGNNGHGRPAYYRRNPPPPFRQGDDFFANFRDFADISTPTKSSYSHYYVVYVNRNASSTDNGNQVGTIGSRHQSIPHNIIEQLQLIDATTQTPDNKLSKTKRKLEKYKQTLQRKEDKKNTKATISPKELYEPLLALS